MRHRTYVALGLLLAFLATSHATRAQDAGQIEGTVVAARSGTAVAGINVVVVGTLYGAVTDAQGRFVISQLPPGDYTLQIDALDYHYARETVAVQPGETVRVQFRLRPPAVTPTDSTFDAVRGPLQPVARVDLDAISTGWATDPAQLLRRMPAGSAGRFGPLGLRPDVRGLAAEQLALRLDGVSLADGDPLGTASTLRYTDPAFIDGIDVVKGPYALTWGPGALGAVRVRQPQAGSVDDLTVQVGYATNVNLWEGAGTWGASVGRWDLLAQGGYRRGNDYEDGNGQIEQGDFASATARGQAAYALSSRSRLTVGGALQDQRDVEEQVPPFERQDVQSVRGYMRYQSAWATGLVRAIEVHASGHQAQHDARRRDVAPVTARPTDGEARTFGVKARARLDPGRAWAVDVGGSVARTDHRAGLASVVLIEAHRTRGGLFVHLHRDGAAAEVQGTVRADLARDVLDQRIDVFAETGSAGEASAETDVLLSAAASVTRKLSPAWRVSLGLGTATRAPTVLERFGVRLPVRTLPTLVVDGRADLTSERSLQADLWVEGDYARWRLAASAFARRTANQIAPVPQTVRPTEPSATVRAQYGNSTSLTAGAEMRAGYRLLGRYLVAHGAGSYQWGRDTERDAPLPDVPPLSLRLGLRATAPADVLYLDGTLHLVAEQDRVADALGALPTAGYVAGDLHLGLRLPRRAALLLGLSNVSSAAYANHLNAVDPSLGARVPEPGLVLMSRLRISL
jgi:iron complex outermembrane receptor protein